MELGLDVRYYAFLARRACPAPTSEIAACVVCNEHPSCGRAYDELSARYRRWLAGWLTVPLAVQWEDSFPKTCCASCCTNGVWPERKVLFPETLHLQSPRPVSGPDLPPYPTFLKKMAGALHVVHDCVSCDDKFRIA